MKLALFETHHLYYWPNFRPIIDEINSSPEYDIYVSMPRRNSTIEQKILAKECDELSLKFITSDTESKRVDEIYNKDFDVIFVGNVGKLNDITNNSFLPEEVLKSNNNDELYESIDRNENHFRLILESAIKKNKRLKYVAELKNGKASVGLREIDENHNFYNIKGSDNIILFYTSRYKDQPLIVKGAGAGADVTAGGIFGDIIRIGKSQ